MSNNRIGAASELIAAAWLMEMGYEVFRNLSPSGPADLIAWKPTEESKYLIDVKTVNKPYTRTDGIVTVPTLNCVNKAAGGVHCLVVSCGRVLGFMRRTADRMGSETYWPFGPSL